MWIECLQRKTLRFDLWPVEVPGRSLVSRFRPVDYRPIESGEVMRVMLDIPPPAALILALVFLFPARVTWLPAVACGK
jgi:hypothetical protein